MLVFEVFEYVKWLQERDDLRSLVDSCQKEVTMTAVSLESLPNSRMEALEKLVDGYRQRMEQLEADPSLVQIDSEGALETF